MNNTLFEHFLHFLADNLDYLLIGIGALFVLLLVVSLIPSKKDKAFRIKGDATLDKARAHIEQTAVHVQALLEGYEGQLIKIEEETNAREARVKELDEVIEIRNQEIKMLEESPDELKATIAQISERSAQNATQKAKGGGFRMFLIGFLLGIATCLAGIATNQNWDYLKTFLPAEWFGA